MVIFVKNIERHILMTIPMTDLGITALQVKQRLGGHPDFSELLHPYSGKKYENTVLLSSKPLDPRDSIYYLPQRGDLHLQGGGGRARRASSSDGSVEALIHLA